jgi:HEAT repeat protein
MADLKADAPVPRVPAPARQPLRMTFGVVMQFIILPMTIVAILVGFFVLGGVLFGGGDSAEDYLNRIRSRSGREAWQAAYELSVLLAKDEKIRKDPALAEQVARAFHDAAGRDVQLRRYLALALGQMGTPGATPVLVDALSDDDPETRGYAVWAIGASGDTTAIDALLPLLSSEDSGLRKVTAYAHGHLGASRVVPQVQPLLNDPVDDVRWNAALALAQLGNREGVETLRQMIDRAYLSGVTGMSEPQRQEVMINAIKALSRLKDDASRSRIEDLSRTDPDLKVRETAMRAIEDWS